MPNGRTGGFHIKVDALAKLLESFPGDTVVGKCLTVGASPGKVTIATPAEVRNLLGKSTQMEIFVDEQDHAWYIVQMDNEWVTVSGSSPLYDSLWRCHLEWLQQIGHG